MCFLGNMSTKLEQASSRIQTAASSATSLSSSKISMFANKTGFVIPKNKLAGSLVPVFRVGKKGASDSVNEDSIKQVQRKTKWGPDLTQDTTVRKARALAYQVLQNALKYISIYICPSFLNFVLKLRNIL